MFAVQEAGHEGRRDTEGRARQTSGLEQGTGCVMSGIAIEQQGRHIADARDCRTVDISSNGRWGDVESVRCYFFSRVILSPPVLFEHMAGAGLSRFFEGSDVTIEDEPPERGLRYVHGRSEAMQGKTTISSVLLARPSPEDVPLSSWVQHLPSIYREFLGRDRSPLKKA